MKEETKINLFRQTASYWLVKTGLSDKYKIIIKKDNRIDCAACVYKDKEKYIIQFSTKKLLNKTDIIHTVLHEIGHLLVDFRSGSDADQEYLAELFALITAKECYRRLYKRMVKNSLRYITLKSNDDIHKNGYTKALKELGEL